MANPNYDYQAAQQAPDRSAGVAVRKQPVLADTMEELDKETMALAECVDRLGMKLEPLMVGTNPNTAAKPEPMPQESSVVCSLQNTTRRLRDLRMLVTEYTHRYQG